MKKFILLIITTFMLTQISVDAKEIMITTRGLLDDSYLEEDNYVFMGNVSWDIPGNYEVDYIHKQTKAVKTKDILISDKEQLLKGLDYSNKNRIQLTDNIDIAKVLFISEGEFFVIGKINTGYYPYQTQDEPCFAYLAYYINNNLQWEKIIKENRYGSLSDICETGKGVAVIGNYESYTENSNIIILEISYTGQIIFEKELSGSLNDYGQKIFYDGSYLYFVGSTDSNNGDFYRNDTNNRDIIVGKLNLKNRELDLIFIGNNSDDIYYDAIFYYDKIYIYLKFCGKGYFTHQGLETNFRSIIYVDTRLELGSWVSLEKYKFASSEKLLFFNNEIALAIHDTQKNNLEFLIYSEKLDFKKIKSLILDNSNYRIINYNFIVNNDSLIVINNVRDLDNKEFNIISFLNDDYLVTQKAKYQADYYTFRAIGGFFDNHHQLFFCNWNQKNNYFDIICYLKLQIQGKTKQDNNYINYEYHLFINGETANSQIVKSNIPSNPFGYYSNLYCLYRGAIKLFLPVERYYPLNINIRNKEIYDVGLKLKFNGQGYLNDELIPNDYEIMEEGKYVLEIIGSEDERKVYHFSISQLSDNFQSENKEINYIQIEETKIYNLPNKKDENFNIVPLQNKINTRIDQTIIYLSGALALGILGGLLLPKKLWRRKKDV